MAQRRVEGCRYVQAMWRRWCRRCCCDSLLLLGVGRRCRPLCRRCRPLVAGSSVRRLPCCQLLPLGFGSNLDVAPRYAPMPHWHFVVYVQPHHDLHHRLGVLIGFVVAGQPNSCSSCVQVCDAKAVSMRNQVGSIVVSHALRQVQGVQCVHDLQRMSTQNTHNWE